MEGFEGQDKKPAQDPEVERKPARSDKERRQKKVGHRRPASNGHRVEEGEPICTQAVGTFRIFDLEQANIRRAGEILLRPSLQREAGAKSRASQNTGL